MNITRKFAVALLCTALFAVGCTDKLGQDEVALDAVVSLRVDEVFQEKAYIRLTHDGSQEDYWYYMLTQDLESDAQLLLEEEIRSTIETDGQLMGNVGTNKNITFENLAAKTRYRAIAARILVDGTIVGNVATLEFVTLRDPAVFERHPLWDITYKARVASPEDLNYEQEVFACTVADTSCHDTYVPCVLEKVYFEKYYQSDLRSCFEGYISEYNKENVKWPKMVRDTTCEHTEERLLHGDYLLFMIGIDSDGELNGYYAMTDCKIEQETPSEDYRRWVGTWTLAGLYSGSRIAYEVEIVPEENNLYYRMYGYEGTTAGDYMVDVPKELPVRLYFEKTTGDAIVVSEELSDLSDPTLAEFYEFFLYGCVKIEYNGVLTDVPVDLPNLRIARFHLSGDSYATASAERFKFDLNGTRYDTEFLYFNYSYSSKMYAGLTPVTTDSAVPRISDMTLVR